MAVKIYTPELEQRLWVGDNVSGLASFVQSLQVRLEESGVGAAAPEAVNRALVWAFDAEGRCLAWFAGDEGLPPELADADPMALIEGLEPPPLRGGTMVGADHYAFEDADEELGMTWTAQPEAWRGLIERQGSEVMNVGQIAQALLAELPKRRERQVDAPLSALMTELMADESEERMAQLLSRLAVSEVGAILTREDSDSGPAVTLGLTEDPDGRAFVLAFADPWEFAHRFGVGFNATVPGGELLRLLGSDSIPHDGVLLNSAVAEKSVIITPAALDLLPGVGEA